MSAGPRRWQFEFSDPGLTHFGGFLAMKHLARWADTYSLLMAPHNVCGPVGTMANVHLAVATPNYKVLEHFNDFADPWVSELVDNAPSVSAADGCFGMPERPGLGVQHDRAHKPLAIPLRAVIPASALPDLQRTNSLVHNSYLTGACL